MRLKSKTPKKYRDESWDYRKADTKPYTHCFHSYPAMMIPQIAGRILDEYAQHFNILFDPYCGTATSLVEANIRGINAIGTDINPLARLIAKVKTTIIPLNLLDNYIEEFNNFILSIKLGKEVNTEIPKFKNIDYWFKKETIIILSTIRYFIEMIKDKDILNFFKVAFSETVRDVSLTRNGEFKLYRMPSKQIEKFNPDVYSMMFKKLLRNRSGMEKYIYIKKNNSASYIYDFNSVYEIPKEIISDESIDIILTSPPYGDSKTTVAYGQFSRLSNQWLCFEKNNEVDKKAMGGFREREYKKFNIEILDETIEKIGEKDNKRVLDVISFYNDYEKSINNVSKVIRKNGIVAYVVGNRKVKGIEIPNDKITVELFKKNGFNYVNTIIREIPNKRMPKKNSPTNEAGKTDNTMNCEYIAIMKKR